MVHRLVWLAVRETSVADLYGKNTVMEFYVAKLHAYALAGAGYSGWDENRLRTPQPQSRPIVMSIMLWQP
jgi:hypothetical protein